MTCGYCGNTSATSSYTCPTCHREGCDSCMPNGGEAACPSCVETRAELPWDQRYNPIMPTEE